MRRESGLLARLHEAYPLAPKPYFFCEDESVIGAPFYVMERRRGVVIDDSFPEGIEPDRDLCRGISETVVDTLVELHAVDPQEAGLGDLGRPEGFLERQAKGWIQRYHEARTDEIEEVGPLARWLSEGVPESPEPTIIGTSPSKLRGPFLGSPRSALWYKQNFQKSMSSSASSQSME